MQKTKWLFLVALCVGQQGLAQPTPKSVSVIRAGLHRIGSRCALYLGGEKFLRKTVGQKNNIEIAADQLMSGLAVQIVQDLRSTGADTSKAPQDKVVITPGDMSLSAMVAQIDQPAVNLFTNLNDQLSAYFYNLRGPIISGGAPIVQRVRYGTLKSYLRKWNSFTPLEKKIRLEQAVLLADKSPELFKVLFGEAAEGSSGNSSTNSAPDEIIGQLELGGLEFQFSRSGKDDKIIYRQRRSRSQFAKISLIYSGTIERIPVNERNVKLPTEVAARVSVYPFEFPDEQSVEMIQAIGVADGTLIVRQMRGLYPEAGIFAKDGTLFSTLRLPKKFPGITGADLVFLSSNVNPIPADSRLVDDIPMVAPVVLAIVYENTRTSIRAETWATRLLNPLKWNQKVSLTPYSTEGDIVELQGQAVKLGDKSYIDFASSRYEDGVLTLMPLPKTTVSYPPYRSWTEPVTQRLP